MLGTKMAPSYANIFMGKLEKLIIQSAPHKPLSWFCFIDDVDMKWTESEICKKCSPLNVKLLCFSTNVSNWTRHSVGGSFTALWSQASRHASIPSSCGMLVYNDVTSIETRMVPEGSGFMDSIFAFIRQHLHGESWKTYHTICTSQATFLVSLHRRRWHEVDRVGRKPQSFLWPCQPSTWGRRWKSTNSEIFFVGCPFAETMGLPGLLTLWILGNR
jgi:hypothetical protein